MPLRARCGRVQSRAKLTDVAPAGAGAAAGAVASGTAAGAGDVTVAGAFCMRRKKGDVVPEGEECLVCSS
jgi:hypothetical protein